MANEVKQQNEVVSSMYPVSTSVSRRRLLLSGVSKGALVLAASTPINTLASTSVFTNTGKTGKPVIRCGISGMQSGKHSRDVVVDVCSGYSPGKYKKLVNWPKLPNDWTANTPCKTVFSEYSGAYSLIDVMLNDSSSDEFHWITAWLNGLKQTPGFYFPYTGPQVLDLYYERSVGGITFTKSAALNFFKEYMELHPDVS